MLEFEPFPKIARTVKNTVTVTEKLDGTNAQILIIDKREPDTSYLRSHILKQELFPHIAEHQLYEDLHFIILAGSRKRYINDHERSNDNYGFAAFVRENGEELTKLGHGRHYGEWYGRGVNRGYGLEERRFALFNTKRWGKHNPNTPSCCEVVPVLYEGLCDIDYIFLAMSELKANGSLAVEGYMKPEGIVCYYTATNSYLKQTFDSPEGKWKDK